MALVLGFWGRTLDRPHGALDGCGELVSRSRYTRPGRHDWRPFSARKSVGETPDTIQTLVRYPIANCRSISKEPSSITAIEPWGSSWGNGEPFTSIEAGTNTIPRTKTANIEKKCSEVVNEDKTFMTSPRRNSCISSTGSIASAADRSLAAQRRWEFKRCMPLILGIERIAMEDLRSGDREINNEQNIVSIVHKDNQIGHNHENERGLTRSLSRW